MSEYNLKKPIHLRVTDKVFVSIYDLAHQMCRDSSGSSFHEVVNNLAAQMERAGAVANPDIIGDVFAFQKKYGVPMSGKPVWPDDEMLAFRHEFLHEEMEEMRVAAFDTDRADLIKWADALADLIYVAVGTMLIAGLPAAKIWKAVQDANMRKQRKIDLGLPYRHPCDVGKPVGWVPPEGEIERAIEEARNDERRRQIIDYLGKRS